MITMLKKNKINVLMGLLLSVGILLSSCGSDSDDDSFEPDVPEATLLRADLSLDTNSVEEGGMAIITLSLDAPNNTGGDLTFDFSFGGTVEPGVDILSLVNTAFVVPNGEDTVTLEVVSIDDDITEDSETFTLEITGIPSGAVAGNTTEVTLTITDND